VQVDTTWIGPPKNDAKSAFEWTGEWTVTYETFRDMGGAFMAALVLIYVLVVWEFGNFRIPGLIMAPIPLTLLGILPAHSLMGAEFTATSMIGWIALAGIIVRNSILLVDFSIHEIRRGTPVREAVILSCKTRTRPILITAFALVAGSSVILTDPIFQGMAISLAAGVLVSTLLTLVVIPLGCIEAQGSLLEIPEDWDRASPITRVSEEAPPCFLIHGDSDTLVPVAEARHFVRALQEKTRAPVAYAELAGAQHAFEIFPSVRTLHTVNAVHRFLAYLHSDRLRERGEGRAAA